MPPTPTIGVFDSGFGGLTVLRALLPLLPNANYIYLGDTARLPYGSKSRETIARYAVSSAKFLHEQGAELLVIACNTATALALEDIQRALPIPVIGVVEPGAQAALTLSGKNSPCHPEQNLQRHSDQSSTSEPNLPCHPEQNLQRHSDRNSTSEPNLPCHPKQNLQRHSDQNSTSEPNLPCHPEQNLQRHSDQNSTSEPNLPCHPERSAAESKDPRFASLAPASANPALSPIENHVLVLATAATVQSHAYTRALNALGLEACEKACPLLVPLVEEGWTNHPVTDEVLRIYLTEALTEAPATQTLLLGCTHYPLLEPAIRRTLATLNHPLDIIDSAQATAHAVAAHPALAPRSEHIAQNCLFYATDSIEKFQRLGSNFLGQPVTEVRHIDLGG